jgi:hypothetical protein
VIEWFPDCPSTKGFSRVEISNFLSWQREVRQIGVSLLFGSGLAIAGWGQATQTFTVTSHGKSVHIPFVNWILIPLGIAAILGLYLFIASLTKLPLVEGSRAKKLDLEIEDKSVRWSVVLENISSLLIYEVTTAPKQEVISMRFENAGGKVVGFKLKDITVSIENIVPPPCEITNPSAILMPGKSCLMGYCPIPWTSTDHPKFGTIEYTYFYGRPENLIYKKHHRLNFFLQSDGSYRWNNVVETDQIL